MDFASALSAIRSLSLEDRIRLVETLSEEIADDASKHGLTMPQQQELQRRLEDDDANPQEVVPWDLV